ncbi:MAG: hypothetical protein IJ336_07750 [Lachnospiraceae bacterium]|nr:hypothetical protein [Lachnospiraceae bacterium]
MKYAKRLLLILVLTFIFATVIGCSEPTLTVNYYVDGELNNTTPDHNFYDFASIECSNEKANATWDENTWKLTTANITKDTTVNIYFEYTDSPFKINGTGYATLQDAFNSVTDTNPVVIETTADYIGFGATPVGSNITLNLNGFTLDGAGFDTITCNGNLVINGDGCITNTVSDEYSKSLVNYGNLTINNVTVLNTTDNVAIWNSNNGGSVMTINDCTITREELDRIVVINSGEMYFNSGTITGAGDKTHPVVYNNADIAVLHLEGGMIVNTSESYTVYCDAGTVIHNDTIAENTYGVETAE